MNTSDDETVAQKVGKWIDLWKKEELRVRQLVRIGWGLGFILLLAQGMSVTPEVLTDFGFLLFLLTPLLLLMGFMGSLSTPTSLQESLLKRLERIDKEEVLPLLVDNLSLEHPHLTVAIFRTVANVLACMQPREGSPLDEDRWIRVCRYLGHMVVRGETEAVIQVLRCLPKGVGPRIVGLLADYVAIETFWSVEEVGQEAQRCLERLVADFDFCLGLPPEVALREWMLHFPAPCERPVLDVTPSISYNWQGLVVEPRYIGLAYLAIGNLLPEISAQTYKSFPKQARLALYEAMVADRISYLNGALCRWSLGNRFVLALLDKLEKCADLDALPYLRQYVLREESTEAQTRAQQVLAFLEARAAQQQNSNYLLRAGMRPASPKEEMLRPALPSGASVSDGRLLLRHAPSSAQLSQGRGAAGAENKGTKDAR